MALSVRWIGNLSILLIVVGGIVPQAQLVHFTGTQITLHIGSLDSPEGMAIDLSGNIYVADNASNSILKLTPSGALSTGFIRGDGSPYGLAVDRSGSLYITDNVKNEVIKETPQPDGSYTKSVLPLSDLNSPLGIAVDVHGNVYIADHLNSRIVKAAPSGDSYTQKLGAHQHTIATKGSCRRWFRQSLHRRYRPLACIKGDALRDRLF